MIVGVIGHGRECATVHRANALRRVDPAQTGDERSGYGRRAGVDRVLSRAAAAWNLSHVLLADGHAEEAETVALHARDTLRTSSEGEGLDYLALHGALLSVAAVAGTRLGQTWAARERLREANKLARLTGERNTAWTAFGPTSVAIHAVSIEIEAGDVGEALRLAEGIEPPPALSIERRVAFLVDQTRGYGQRQDYGSALVALQAASIEAPEDMTYRPAVHAVLRTVIQRGRATIARQGAALATRFNITF